MSTAQPFAMTPSHVMRHPGPLMFVGVLCLLVVATLVARPRHIESGLIELPSRSSLEAAPREVGSTGWETYVKQNADAARKFVDKYRAGAQGGPAASATSDAPVHADVLFLGDSITHFMLRGGNDIPNWIGKERVLILGIPGDTCSELLYRLQVANEVPAAISPRVVSVLIGTNDLGKEVCQGMDCARRIFVVLYDLVDRFPDAKIVVSLLLPRALGRVRQTSAAIENGLAAVEEVNNAMRALLHSAHRRQVAGFERVSWVDCKDVFLAKDGTGIDAELMPDLLHPSVSGNKRWMEQCLRHAL
ncbi:Platelet-activating factor acetylhydrolase IB subunit gamma [Porphyridium purpureum]|uniref:Platelet-activating factor acetylhydrolase IB subunit gamma n=1 Tax=Porphyridium purpureum TaxID=35688 RepID=A0A5J4YNZ4_PORPP|nr:Platelet-activating factor acetylhydrolase IB subunit gamma [Porphyridium purpureum]|eukprot:POR1363..scf296_7